MIPFQGADYLQVSFDSPGVGTHEAHLSVGDSGGGVFMFEDGLWKLAAINYAVDEIYSAPDPATGFAAAVFDARGFYSNEGNGNFSQIPVNGPPVPTSFYSTRIASRLAWIQSVTGLDPTVLPPANLDDWRRAYFSPAEMEDPTVSGPNADPDADGVPTLLEFAFNLDPRFSERVTMTADTGVRGLPLIRQEPIASADDLRLTVEFVRRTAGSGSGLTYAVQFANDLATAAAAWQTADASQEVVTPINARWERVKVTDGVAAPTAAGSAARFARVVVTQAATP